MNTIFYSYLENRIVILKRIVTYQIVQIESQLENDAVNSRRTILRGGKHFFSTFLDLLQIIITVLISPKFWAKMTINCSAFVGAKVFPLDP